MRTIVFALLISLATSTASAAQSTHDRSLPRTDAPFEFRGNVFSRPAWEPAPSNGDSLKNGAIIGAVAGGIALGSFVGLLCYAFREPGNPSCVPATLVAGGIGAGAGAAAGAGIDALFQKRASLGFTVKF